MPIQFFRHRRSSANESAPSHQSHTVPLTGSLSANIGATLVISSDKIADLITPISSNAFSYILEKEIARVKRYQHDLSLLLCELSPDPSADLMTYQTLVQVLSQRLRAYDFIALWHNEKVVCLLPETDAQQAIFVANELVWAFDKEISTLQYETPVTSQTTNLHIGVSSYGVLPATASELIKQVELALDEAVQSRIKVCLFQASN